MGPTGPSQLEASLWQFSGGSNQWQIEALEFGATEGSGADHEEPDIMMMERIGKIGIGTPASELAELIGSPIFKGIEEPQEATGTWVQHCKVPDAGLEIHLESEEKGQAKSVSSITVTKTSPFKTSKGIGIGATVKEVDRQYSEFLNKEDGDVFGENCYVAGSIYGGVIFEFEGGRVSNIFVGAAAE